MEYSQCTVESFQILFFLKFYAYQAIFDDFAIFTESKTDALLAKVSTSSNRGILFVQPGRSYNLFCL